MAASRARRTVATTRVTLASESSPVMACGWQCWRRLSRSDRNSAVAALPSMVLDALTKRRPTQFSASCLAMRSGAVGSMNGSTIFTSRSWCFDSLSPLVWIRLLSAFSPAPFSALAQLHTCANRNSSAPSSSSWLSCTCCTDIIVDMNEHNSRATSSDEGSTATHNADSIRPQSDAGIAGCGKLSPTSVPITAPKPSAPSASPAVSCLYASFHT